MSDDDDQLRERFDRSNRSQEDIPVPEPTVTARTSGNRTSSRGRYALAGMGVLVVMVVVVGFVVRRDDGAEVATQGSVPVGTVPATPVTAGPKAGCGGSTEVREEQLERASAVVGSSPYEGSGVGPGIPSLGAARQLGQLLPPATIEAVTAVDLVPYNLIPGERGAGPTNSSAGNAAFWSGIRVRVASETGTLEVPIALAAGGADVVRSLMADVDRSAFDALVGTCAVVFVVDEPQPNSSTPARL